MNEKICPLLLQAAISKDIPIALASNRPILECWREQYAWWTTYDDGHCAIIHLADVRRVADKLADGISIYQA